MILLNTLSKRFNVGIRGTRPLVMHSTRVMMQEKSGRGDRMTAEQEVELSLYKDSSGSIVVPSECILACMKAAASDYKVPGKGKKTFKQYTDSGLDIEPTMPILQSDGYVTDLRPVVVQKSRIIRARPKFENWSVEFTIVVNDSLWLDSSGGGRVIREILESAGKYKGLLEMRPRFGRFEVTKFEESPD